MESINSFQEELQQPYDQPATRWKRGSNPRSNPHLFTSKAVLFYWTFLQAKQSRWVTKCQERWGGTIHSVKPILHSSFAFTLWMVPWPWMSTFSLRRSSWQAWRAKPGPVKVVTKICTFKASKKVTLQGTNHISHLGKRKIIFKMPFWGDMLVPTRVSLVIFFSWLNAIIVNSKVGQNFERQETEEINWLCKKRKAWSKQGSTLQDLASIAENSHKDCLRPCQESSSRMETGRGKQKWATRSFWFASSVFHHFPSCKKKGSGNTKG